ncbi:MAG TPA: YihY/virulence factor BrkB family protein [Longimicrobiales bacterium]|nr:YihY/virulence factor BrkB family protein [Longimicrobiales bacterium]
MRHLELLARGREFLRLLWEKADDDDALFIAAAIAWGVLFALVPLLALGIGLTGFVLSARFDDPTDAVVTLFARVLPEGEAGADLADLLRSLVGEVMVNATGLTVLGSLVFVWFASRLSGSLRSALFKVFEVGVRRGLVVGKLFDMVAVSIGVVLVTLNMGVTVLLSTAMEFGVQIFGWGGPSLSYAERLLGVTIAFASIWTLFVIVYRYLPIRRTPWKTTLIAATFSALAHEALKFAFSWYAVEMANYTSTLGNLATIAVLLLWIYYGALVFILGGEVAHVYGMLEGRRSEAD